MSLRRLVILACALGCSTPDRVAYVGAEVFDGTGTPPILDAVIVVRDGKIEAIGAPDVVEIPRGAVVVRVDGKFVVPGFVDAHTHVDRWAIDLLLAHGVTTIRDFGGAGEHLTQLAEDVSLSRVLGPRMYLSGSLLDAGGSRDPSVTNVTSAAVARQAVDHVALEGFQQAAVLTKIDARMLEPIMDEARMLNVPVAGHLGKVDALTAARLGIASLEHLSGIAQASVTDPGSMYRAYDDYRTGWTAVERAWPGLDSARLHHTAAELIRAEVTVVPTLGMREAAQHAGGANEDLRDVPDTVRARWAATSREADLDASGRQALAAATTGHHRFIRIFHGQGGRIAVGSDAPNRWLPPGASFHREMELLVSAGLSPRDVLLAATRNGARVLELDSLGTLQAGKVADFLVLTSNPLEDIRNARGIETVVFRGVAHDVSTMRAGSTP